MDHLEEFYREKEKNAVSFTHIEEDTGNPVLKRIDEVYGAADSLSLKYAYIYRRIILALSVAGTLLTIAFLLYDEVSLYWMILVCGAMILMLFGVNMAAGRLRCHGKYLEYRLLAEGARVQYYLFRAGLKQAVVDLLPWAWQFNVPWTKQVLSQLMQDCGEKSEENAAGNAAGNAEEEKRESILDLWVLSQAEYHRDALVKTKEKIKRNDRITKAALVLALVTYAAALVFEICACGLFGGTVRLSSRQMETGRTILKVATGSFSAMTLFAGNYYGKLSLEDTAQDHRRMAALFKKTEIKILREGETRELLIKLAEEELAENSNWYAYQSKNQPDISI